MINAIAELGRFKKASDPNIKSNFDIWIEDSYDEINYPHLLLIEFNKVSNKKNDDLFKDNQKWNFYRVSYLEHSSVLKPKLLYKRGSPRGTDITPTCKTTKDIVNSYKLKIKPWFKNKKNASFLDDKNNKFLGNLFNVIEQNNEEICNQLKSISQNITSGGTVLSVTFYEDGERKYIGDYKIFRRFITEDSKSNYFRKYKKESISHNKQCSICNKVRKEVFGFFSTLAFYSADKSGMVTGGFDQSKSWKNYPICLDCALNVELGYQLMEENLIFNFYGLRYYLIPKILNIENIDNLIDKIIDYKRSPKVNDSNREQITNAEDEVFDLIKEEKNNITFDLLFFDKPQKSVFRILALVEEILPSRLKKLFNSKEYVDKMTFFQEKKEGKAVYRFNFGILRTFFPNSKEEGDFDKSFLELTNRIFSDKKIDYGFIIKQIMYILRSNFVKDQFFLYNSVKSFMVINYLNTLNLFRLKNTEDEMDGHFYQYFEIKVKDEFKEKIELFFDNFKKFFTSYVHKGIFLTGVLTQFLLNIQKQERDATPFRSKLKGLKMDAKDITSLLPQIIDKLEQYRKNYYVPLENLISEYYLLAGDFRKWKLSIDEMNYIFVLGMNLSKYFKIKTEEKIEEE